MISHSQSPLRNEEGLVIGRPKSPGISANDKLKEAEIRFQAHLLSAVEQAVIATDLKGDNSYWNTFAEWLYGLDHADTRRQHYRRHAGSDTRERLRKYSQNSAKATVGLEKFIPGEGWNSVPAQVTDSPIFGEMVTDRDCRGFD